MGAPTPDVIIEPFGTGNAGSITLPIPVPSQLPANPGYASFTDGFPTDTAGAGSLPPRWQDMQGILYMLSAYCQAITGGQFWSFNATWEAANSGYAAGAVLAMAAGNGFWLNTTSGNANNPDTAAAATSGWVPLAAYGESSIALSSVNVTLTAVQAATPTIVLSGTLTANVQLIFPPWLYRWRIINNCTGNFTVLATTGVGNGAFVPPLSSYGVWDIYCDGTSIWSASSPVDKLHTVASIGSGQSSTRTTTTLSADTYLTQTIFLPGTYLFRCSLNDGIAQSAGGGLAVNFAFSGTLTLGNWGGVSNGATDTLPIGAIESVRQGTPPSGFEISSLQSGNGRCMIDGWFTCTTQGTFALWWAAESTPGSGFPSTLGPGSYLEILPAINLQSEV